jgi:hypothetical protein
VDEPPVETQSDGRRVQQRKRILHAGNAQNRKRVFRQFAYAVLVSKAAAQRMFWYDCFKKRVLLNASKAYVMQLDIAQEFKLLKPVYSLNFVNGTFEKSPEMEHEYYHHYKIVNIKDTKKQIEGLEFVFLELPKFKPQNRAEKKTA